MEKNKLILDRLLKALTFFVVCLLILTIARLVFILHFRPQDLPLADFVPAFLMGVRLDAKWLSILLLPAWPFFLFSWKFPRLFSISCLLGILGTFLIFLLAEVNFGFYGFYSTPINSTIFGLVQDDTSAILTTLWSEWPILKYLVLLIFCTAIPVAIVWKIRWPWQYPSNLTICVCLVVITALLGVMSRGSFGKFPLRYQHFAVSTNTFVNASVINGAAALNEANNTRDSLSLKGDTLKVAKDMGFPSVAAAENTIKKYKKQDTAGGGLSFNPHIVFVVMESMGRDLLDSDDASTNDMLGDLRPLLDSAVVFRNGLSIQNGTFLSLEGLLFKSPLSPLTQSEYGRKQFPFSELLDLKKAGYKTVLLMGSSESWRQIDTNFKVQGFDEILGSTYIKSKNPNIEEAPWGVGDRWLFKEAFNLIQEADKKGEKLFLMVLSSTNHPPYKVPDGENVMAVDTTKIPSFLKPDYDAEELKNLMQTYQYASDCLADLIINMGNDGILEKSVIVVTGDHNSRIGSYEPVGYWHHNYGVPIIFWIPDEEIKKRADTSQWVSHWDIFPTLKKLALNIQADEHYGRDLFSQEREDGALTFNSIPGGEYGFVVGKSGAVALGKQGKLVCYHWNNDDEEKLVINNDEKCTEQQAHMGELAKAQRALIDYIIRKSVLSAGKSS